MIPPDEQEQPFDEPQPSRKLDLAYFTEPNRCPLMVTHRARRAFELFLYMAHRCMTSWGEPISPTHEELCLACGLDPQKQVSRPTLSRLLRALRDTYGVIDYQPVRKRRPEIRLRPTRHLADPLNPPHYVYLHHGWGTSNRQVFETLGNRAFAAEYMYLISQYEAAVALRKQNRDYWFYPLTAIAATFHVSTQFASIGLQALVDLGVAWVSYGRYESRLAGEEVARANRFYFVGLSGRRRREEELQQVDDDYEADSATARAFAKELINGQTAKNVRGLCQLIATYGKKAVAQAVASLEKSRRNNPRRRLAYIATVLERGRGDESGASRANPRRVIRDLTS